MNKSNFWLFKKAMLLVSMQLFFYGCPKNMELKICKNDADCENDAKDQVQKGVCYMGKCEECISNTDCKDLKECIHNRCKSTCKIDADCPSNQEICRLGQCVSKDGIKKEDEHTSKDFCPNVKRIHFDFDKYDLSKEYKDALDTLADCLKEKPNGVLIIEGHTDDRGTPSYNMVLAEKRANVARNYLVKDKRVDSIRVKTVSYGKEKPLMDEKNEYAWQQNRRAEFLFE